MREKSIDEATGGTWVIFGTRKDGTVDVSEASRDVFEGVPVDIAEKLCSARDRLMVELYEILRDV